MKNTKYIQIRQTGCGHWRITIEYYGKEISATTTDSMAIDDYNSEEWEKDGRELRKKRGFTSLRNEVISKHNNT